jgi:predicted flap endonuclease-1-like 5' DNA nuclease
LGATEAVIVRRGRPEKPEAERTSGSRRKGKNRAAVAALVDDVTAAKPATAQGESAKKTQVQKARRVGADSARRASTDLIALLGREITISTTDDNGKVRRKVLLSRDTRRRLMAAASNPVTVDDLRALIALGLATAQALFEQGLLAPKDLLLAIRRAESAFVAVLQQQQVGGMDALLHTTFAAPAASAADVPGREHVVRSPPTEVGDLIEVSDG